MHCARRAFDAVAVEIYHYGMDVRLAATCAMSWYALHMMSVGLMAGVKSARRIGEANSKAARHVRVFPQWPHRAKENSVTSVAANMSQCKARGQ